MITTEHGAPVTTPFETFRTGKKVPHPIYSFSCLAWGSASLCLPMRCPTLQFDAKGLHHYFLHSFIFKCRLYTLASLTSDTSIIMHKRRPVIGLLDESDF